LSRLREADMPAVLKRLAQFARAAAVVEAIALQRRFQCGPVDIVRIFHEVDFRRLHAPYLGGAGLAACATGAGTAAGRFAFSSLSLARILSLPGSSASAFCQ